MPQQLSFLPKPTKRRQYTGQITYVRCPACGRGWARRVAAIRKLVWSTCPSCDERFSSKLT